MCLLKGQNHKKESACHNALNCYFANSQKCGMLNGATVSMSTFQVALNCYFANSQKCGMLNGATVSMSTFQVALNCYFANSQKCGMLNEATVSMSTFQVALNCYFANSQKCGMLNGATVSMSTFQVLPPILMCRFESQLGSKFSGFSMWHFLRLIVRGFVWVLQLPVLPLVNSFSPRNKAKINMILTLSNFLGELSLCTKWHTCCMR